MGQMKKTPQIHATKNRFGNGAFSRFLIGRCRHVCCVYDGILKKFMQKKQRSHAYDTLNRKW